jgi:hypothetical protein
MIDILLRVKLEPLARASRRSQLCRALARVWVWAAGAAVLLWLLALVVPGLGRVAVPAVAAGAGLAALVLGWRIQRRVTDYRQLAREIEQEHPDLDSALLAAVEQKPDPATHLLGYLQHRVIEAALQHRTTHTWGTRLVQQLKTAQALQWLALAALGASLLCLRTAAPVATSAGRPAALRLFGGSGVTVTPGDTELERGHALVVAARFGGRVPPAAELVITPKSGAVQRLSLTKNLNDPIFGGGLPEVQGDLTYRVEYGDEHTRDFTVKVFEHPNLNRADALLSYPAYTQLPQKTIEDTRRVSAVEGTKVDLSFELNKPVKSAKLMGKDDAPELVLTVDTNRANVYHASLTLDASRRYELRLLDDDGRTNKVPPLFQLDALPNRAPELKLAFPRGDQEVTALEEVSFQAETWDDFGVRAYGLGYALAGEEPKFIELGQGVPPKEKQPFKHLLPMEDLAVQPDQLVSYFLWAEDVGPDGQVRRSTGDMFFAEVRPFDEIFREDQQGGSGNQGQGEQGPSTPTERLADLQKQIITATWNIQRRESGAKPSSAYKKDIGVVHQSQEQALEQAQELGGRSDDPRSQALVEAVQKAMQKAVDQLGDAEHKVSTKPLPQALSAEQSAYQALLKLQAREYRVSQSRSGGGGGGGRAGRSRRQLDQLELKQSENRYETQRQAGAQRNPEQRQQLQTLSRLRELARRQQDINERLKELQTALQEARNEEEREQIRRELKRLREEQREILADLDDVRQRLARAETPQLSQQLQRLDDTRNEVREAAEALEGNQVSRALASGARAQRELQELREDFRKQSASEFSDEMRQMRNEARQLAQRQEEIGQKLDGLSDTQPKSLRDTDDKAVLAEQMQRQVSGLTNILTQMRQVSEQSEVAEPLLSRQLYDTLRKTEQSKLDNSLEAASQLVQRGFTQQAGQFEERARRGINELKQGVERAAESVLGDETEALRLARAELDALTQQLEQEASRAEGRTNNVGQASNLSNSEQSGRAQNTRGSGQTNDPSATSRTAQSSNQPGSQPADRGDAQQASQPPGEGQQQANASAQSAQPQPGRGQQSASAQPGQNSGQAGQAGQGQQGGQPAGGQQASAGGGQGGQQQAAADSGQTQGGRGGTQSLRGGDGQRAGGGSRSGRGGWFDQDGWGTAGALDGPLTGRDFRNWADRLGEVEELVDLPELRTEIAGARDRARAARAEFQRHGKEPQWPLVRLNIIAPLVEVRKRISEELARRQSNDSLVPIDRDPVPPKYAERVRRYYEELGRSE